MSGNPRFSAPNVGDGSSVVEKDLDTVIPGVRDIKFAAARDGQAMRMTEASWFRTQSADAGQPRNCVLAWTAGREGGGIDVLDFGENVRIRALDIDSDSPSGNGFGPSGKAENLDRRVGRSNSANIRGPAFHASKRGNENEAVLGVRIFPDSKVVGAQRLISVAGNFVKHAAAGIGYIDGAIERDSDTSRVGQTSKRAGRIVQGLRRWRKWGEVHRALCELQAVNAGHFPAGKGFVVALVAVEYRSMPVCLTAPCEPHLTIPRTNSAQATGNRT